MFGRGAPSVTHLPPTQNGCFTHVFSEVVAHLLLAFDNSGGTIFPMGGREEVEVHTHCDGPTL